MQLLATWNRGGDYWQRPQVDIFGHSVAYSETLPKSGTTRNGQLYERPTLEHPTTAPASSSSHGQTFPTPKASDWMFGRPKTTGRPIEKAQHLQTIVTLLPTPDAAMGDRGASSIVGGQAPIWAPSESRSEHGNGAPADPGSVGLQARRLPSGQEPEVTGDHNSQRPLPDTPRIVRELGGEIRGGRARHADCHNRNIEWGRYAPAVRRWERTLGTPAPAPTEPNTKGKPRLNAAFAEWMMGLPEGWVTSPEIGLTRAQQLKALGNGVVPQQAQAALTHLLERR